MPPLYIYLTDHAPSLSQTRSNKRPKQKLDPFYIESLRGLGVRSSLKFVEARAPTVDGGATEGHSLCF